MLTRWIPGLAVFCLAVPLVSIRAADAETTKPIIVVRVRSLDAVASNGRYLGELAGNKEIAKQAEGIIRARIGDKGLEGIDTKRPIGGYANDVSSPFPIIMVPIKDEKAFLDLLQTLNVEPKKGKDGLYTAKLDFLPAEPDAYFRFANGYAYITALNSDSVSRDRLMDPSNLKVTEPNTLLCGTFYLERVPPEIKQIAVDQVRDRFRKLAGQKPPRETPDQQRVRLQLIRDVSALVVSIIKDGGEAAVHVDIDRRGNNLGLEFSLTAKPDSALAQNIMRVGENVSLFDRLLNGQTAAGGLAHFTVPADLRKLLGPIIDNGMKQALAKEPDARNRALAEKFFQAIRPTLQAGELDVMGALRGPNKAGLYTGILALKLRDGQNIEKVVEEIIKAGPPTERVKFMLNADTAGPVAIHQIILKDGVDPSFRKTYGDGPGFFCIRKDALLITLGPGSLDALKGAIKETTTPVKPRRSGALELHVSLGQLVPLIKQSKNPEAARLIQEAAGRDNKDPGEIRFVLEGGKALKARLSGSGAVVKFLSEAAKLRTRQARPDQEKALGQRDKAQE